MRLWWSDQAYRKFEAYGDDLEVRAAFQELLGAIRLDPLAGIVLDRIGDSSDPLEQRAAQALSRAGLARQARVLLVEVRRPPKAGQPPLLAVAVHLGGVPAGVAADHSLLLLGVLYRQYAGTDRQPG